MRTLSLLAVGKLLCRSSPVHARIVIRRVDRFVVFEWLVALERFIAFVSHGAIFGVRIAVSVPFAVCTVWRNWSA